MTTCNKCKGKGSYRTDRDTLLPLPCSRCKGTGRMTRQTKAERRLKRLQRREKVQT